MNPVTSIDVLYEVMKSYQRRVMTNIHRSAYVEALVSIILSNHGWSRMTQWDSWDMEHVSRARLEVKQSAAAQSWSGDRSSPARFDTAPRTRYWDDKNGVWKNSHGRHADIYVFAWHGQTREEGVDQRDPMTWAFHVIAEHDLPNQKSIGLSRIQHLAPVCSLSGLGPAVDKVRVGLQKEHVR